MKNCLSLLLIVLLLLCTISLVSCNGNQGPFIATNIVNGSEGLEYIAVKQGLAYAVYGIGECTDANIVIPEKVNGKPVIEIAEGAFKNNATIVSVQIPDSVEKIDKKAFSGCSNLEFQSINIGTNDSNLKEIGAHLFFSSYVSTINYKGTMAEWKSIKFDASEGQSWNYNRGMEITVVCNDGILIYHSTDPSVEPEEIPHGSSNNNTNDNANNTYKGLEFTLNEDGESYSLTGDGDSIDTEVIIPSTYNGKPVTNIADGAFVWNDVATKIVIPNSVTNIERQAFAFCSALITITIPDSVINIGEFAFSNCWSLENIEVDINNQYYKSIDGNFYTKNGDTLIQYAIGKKEESFVIPNSVQHISDYALSSCQSLKYLTIPDSVTSIGWLALYVSRELSFIEVDENNPEYKSIDGNLYTKDGETLIQYAIGKKDTSFTIPNGVKVVDVGAFWRAVNLTSVIIPDSVLCIRGSAFVGCESLLSIAIPDSVTEIESDVFSSCSSLETVTLSNYLESIPFATFQDCTSLTNIVIPSSVTYIDANAFRNCTSLKSIVIPDSVDIIGSGAFENCTSLTNVTIGKNVVTMGNQVFKNCISLTSVIFKDTAGWFYMDFPNSTDLVVISIDLNNPSTAAQYLTGTYCDYQWLRLYK